MIKSFGKRSAPWSGFEASGCMKMVAIGVAVNPTTELRGKRLRRFRISRLVAVGLSSGPTLMDAWSHSSSMIRIGSLVASEFFRK